MKLHPTILSIFKLREILLFLVFIFFTQTSVSDENKFSLAGFENQNRVKSFLLDLQNSIKTDKKRHVATMILFPLAVTILEKRIEIESMEGFLKNYDTIFNDKVKKAIFNESVETLSVKSNGVMIGRGEVWFASYTIGKKKMTVITAINNK